ncbi:Stk1 family PASTA domain-containing Ser/Thr kinase [Sinosporangium siamense]|uniref:non-specific serine/threonine protein kinase n=1 Tax=Sinosporangium siamense TaxID=1367973 RepID=A0A919V4Y2_9ACTN|nr:Stk1 family PASTA domain-containing Ser/Thr kinase [Sinosporangium siamense]GII90241.1 serine/threonine protein kinase [Sinosporangium siamense]
MDTTDADALVGRLLDGRYRVESRLAHGGMATVYLALDVRLDRTVALKVMHGTLSADPSFVRRFIGEAKSVASLSHPNIVQVFDQGTDGSTVYLSMEYVPGRTLRDVLRGRGRLPARDALELMIPVLAALGSAHQAGLVHRDVKPENVLLAEDGRVKVVDFGLARAIASSNQTRTGLMIGTIGYMSPEQVTTGVVDARSDVYAAGVMLFELLTGRQPYEGESPMAIAYKHVHDEVPAPSSIVPDLPPIVDALVAQSTAREAEDRFADATAMLVASVEAHRTLPAGGSGVRAFYQPNPNRSSAGSPGPSGSPGSSGSGAEPPGRSGAPKPPPGVVPNQTLIQPKAAVLAAGTAPAGRSADKSGRSAEKAGKPKFKPHWFLIGLAVVMVIGMGITGVWLAQEDPVKVPELMGKTLTVAKGEAAKVGLTVEVLQSEHDNKITEGKVLRTDPAAGAEVDAGSTIKLVPSLGPVRVIVPNVAGLSEAEARTAIANAGLTIDEIKRIADKAVPRDKVIRSSPQIGTKVRKGGRIDLVLSAGLVMPDVTGMLREQAETTLREAGFQVNVVEQIDDAQPGTVIAQSPPAKAEVNPGDTANLTVSKSDNFQWPWDQDDDDSIEGFVTIPNVMHKNVQDAQTELQTAGLKVKTRKIAHGGSGLVKAQRPLAGAVPPGTEIWIWH